MLAICLGRQAEVLVAQGKTEQALQKLSQQQEMYSVLRIPVGKVECIIRQAELLRKDAPAEALEQLHHAAHICREIGLYTQLVLALTVRSQIQLAYGDKTAALETLRATEQVCRLHADHQQLLECLGKQALVLRQMHELAAALTTLEEQSRIARKIGDASTLATSLGNQAAIYETRGEYELAICFYHKGEKICRRIANPSLLARNLANQAFCLSDKMNWHAEALVRAEEAYGLASENSLSKLAAQIERIRHDIQLRKSHITSAGKKR